MLTDRVRFTHHRSLGVPEGERVSLVVVSHQRVAQLESLLGALRCQTHPNFQVTVVHDGPDPAWARDDEWTSHFANLMWAHGDWRFHFVVHPENLGLWGYPIRHQYEAMSDGDWIGELCDDDWVAPTYLEQLLHAAISQGADVAHCDYVHNFTNWNPVQTEPRQDFIGIGGWLARREVALAHGYPRPLCFTSDGKRIEAMRDAGAKFARVPAHLMVHG